MSLLCSDLRVGYVPDYCQFTDAPTLLHPVSCARRPGGYIDET